MSVTSATSNDDKTLTIKIQGAFNFSIVHEFRSSYSDVTNQFENVVVDLEDATHLDSSALGMLLNLKRYIESGDGEIRIINTKRDVKKILQIAHFEKLFEIT